MEVHQEAHLGCGFRVAVTSATCVCVCARAGGRQIDDRERFAVGITMEFSEDKHLYVSTYIHACMYIAVKCAYLYAQSHTVCIAYILLYTQIYLFLYIFITYLKLTN